MTGDLLGARIGVIGLGYVGLPLAVAFAQKFDVVGFDIDPARVTELRRGHDRTLEVSDVELSRSALRATTEPKDLDDVDVYIVTTPTPVDPDKRPDLRPVLAATRTVAASLAPGNIVVYESTVYPGATEEDCVPLLEELSGLRLNEDFFVGYSPERINPGDKDRTFETIVKVTSGSTPESAQFIDALYRTVVGAGTHLAPSIKVAEAAKVIENTQRDVNIALINELAVIFSKLEIDTLDVLEAAGTKWNFLPFRPGLVGGHCIGVDPYYLTHRAQAAGHLPDLILTGRRINNGMGAHVATEMIKRLIQEKASLADARILILGLTFKENCPDLRNTRVVDIVTELEKFGLNVDVYDPWVEPKEAHREYGITMTSEPSPQAYAGIILAVAHDEFAQMSESQVQNLRHPDGSVVYDLKSVLPRSAVDLRL